jgi:lipopolysaccharide transport system permease protein
LTHNYIHFTKLSLSLGWQDLKQAYRRSALGPFWLTLGMAVQVLATGLVFSLIFDSPVQEFLPFLAVSLILWTFISTAISDGAMAFVSGEAIIRQLALPHYVHVLRSIWKNTLVLLHNLAILPIVFMVFLKPLSLNLLFIIPGFLVTSAFLLSATYVLGLITTRFRDVQQIVSSAMTVLFFVTPVIWQPSLIPAGMAHLLLGLNPLYHFLQLVRLPILDQAPTLDNWTLALFATILTTAMATLASRKYKSRLAYWV